MTNQTRTLITLSAAAAVVFGVGCSSDKKHEASQDPFFPARDSVPASKTMFKQQADLAAAQDGMLFDLHFDGADLNSLGQAKIEAMIRGKSKTAPLKVFLNMPKDAADTNARQTNVDAVLKAAGLASNQYALAIGPNPGVLAPADAGVRALALQRGTQGDATASGESTNLPVKEAK